MYVDREEERALKNPFELLSRTKRWKSIKGWYTNTESVFDSNELLSISMYIITDMIPGIEFALW